MALWKWHCGKLVKPDGDDAPLNWSIAGRPAEAKRLIVRILALLNADDGIQIEHPAEAEVKQE